MKEAAIIAGVLVVGYLLLKRGNVTATVSTPGGDALPAPQSISGAPIVPGGYLTVPPRTMLGTGDAVTGATGLPSYVAPAPVLAPPPPYYGGTGGTVGTGGAGLGGPVVAGVSQGTATTTRTITVKGRSASVVAARAAGHQIVGINPSLPVVVG